MKNVVTVTFPAFIEETEYAIGLRRPEKDQRMDDVWLPLNHLDKIVRRKDGSVVVTMARWLAAKEGWT